MEIEGGPQEGVVWKGRGMQLLCAVIDVLLTMTSRITLKTDC